MNPIEINLDDVHTLPELFERWQKEQKESGPAELSCARDRNRSRKESTFPDLSKYAKGKDEIDYHDDFCMSFCYDGRLTEWQEGRKTVLFICREANIADEEHIDKDDKDKEMLLPETMREGNCPENFWMKEQYLCPEKRKNNKYYKLIQKVIGEPSESVNLAYMNLNKRGGFGKCNMARIGHYVDLYQKFIRKEIELIAPDVIICGGTFGFVNEYCLADELIKTQKKEEIICRDFYHPAARGGIREKKENAIDLVSGQRVKID